MSQAFNPYNHNTATGATASNDEDDNVSMRDSPQSKSSDSETSKQAHSSEHTDEEQGNNKHHEHEEE